MKHRYLRATALAFGVLSACSAHAIPAVVDSNTLDFEGFTVSWDNVDWSTSVSYDYAYDMLNTRFDYYSGQTYTGGGVRGNGATVFFTAPTLVAEAFGANDATTVSTSAMVTVTAKPGWTLGSIERWGVSGTWGEYNGGSANVNMTSEFTISPSTAEHSSYDGALSMTSSVSGSTGEAGSWSYYTDTIGASGYVPDYGYFFDPTFGPVSYQNHQLNPSGQADQITDNINITLTATNGSHSRAYSFAELTSPGNYTISAYRAITPVPEAETWLMMIAGTGLIGYVLRRRKQQDTAAAPLAAA